MLLTITSIHLRSPFHFFGLSYNALKIIKQLSTTNCKAKKTIGFWTKHYTMTLWENEEQMKDFARNGAHLEAMKLSPKIANEIRTLTIESDVMPNWKTAKHMLLEKGQIFSF